MTSVGWEVMKAASLLWLWLKAEFTNNSAGLDDDDLVVPICRAPTTYIVLPLIKNSKATIPKANP